MKRRRTGPEVVALIMVGCALVVVLAVVVFAVAAIAAAIRAVMGL